MGVKNLYKLVEKFAPDAISDCSKEELKGWKLGIDANLAVYQWSAAGKSQSIVNSSGRPINHIQGAFFRTISLIKSGITPVYIFDGPPPQSKETTMEERRKSRANGSSHRLPPGAMNDVMNLFALMGVYCVKSPVEADSQAAYMCRIGELDGVATEDMDALPFGATCMVRGLGSNAKRVKIIDTSKVLSGLKLTMPEFIDVCILLGCDYAKTSKPKIGHLTVLPLIREYKNIENILDRPTKLKVDYSAFTYAQARDEFTNPIVDKSTKNIKLKKLTLEDIGKIRDFLVLEHGLDLIKIKKSLSFLTNYHGLLS